MEEENHAVFILEPIQGKGYGLIASQHIPSGACILREEPLFTIQPSTSEPTLIEQLIATKLRQLTKDKQRHFFALHNNYPEKLPFSGIIKTNMLPLGPGSSAGGLFLQCSRINHSCLPNSQHTWNDTAGCETIYAVKDISKGEEITIMYADGPSQTRRRRLKEVFGFDCSCILCQLSGAERQASDERLAEIQRLDDRIGNASFLMSKPTRCLGEAYQLLVCFNKEGITDVRVARLYYDAFQIAITHGDQARAKAFAEKAFQVRRNCEGEDSPGALKMRSFATDPSQHMSYGMSTRWRSSVEPAPKNLNEREFDAWLWKKDM